MTYTAPRLLSHTEIDTALACFARWDFAYGGHLAGATLKAREVAPVLSDGRAWGNAVAAYHAADAGVLGVWNAHTAIARSLAKDAAEMMDRGWPLPSLEARIEQDQRLSAILDHYASLAEPFGDLTRLEGELVTGVPSRGVSGRASGTYRFLCYLDGFTNHPPELPAGEWPVEFKLRQNLTPPAILQKQRQPRWYAWAYWQVTGRRPTGVIVEERLNRAPEPAKILASGKPSHSVAQFTTAELYIDACHERDEEPHLNVIEALRGRMWQHRFPIVFRKDELDLAGRELRDMAKLIRDLDHGNLTPLRNAQRGLCGRCRYAAICDNPTDDLAVDALFERTVPKRERGRLNGS